MDPRHAWQRRLLLTVSLLALTGFLTALATADTADKPLLDLAAAGALDRVSPNQPDQVSVARAEDGTGFVVTCRLGKNDYPGVTIKPEAGPWDLSAYGHVEARVVNVGAVASGVSLRVDNAGDWTTNPWNGESLWLKPGEAGTVRVRFGYSWGKPGFALNPAKITQVLLIVGRSDKDQAFRIESLVAGGAAAEKPPVDPESIRVRPIDGVILGKGATVDQALCVTLPAGSADASVMLRPEVGKWDLRDWLQIVIHARNEGKGPVTLRARLENRDRPGAWVEAAKPLAPGAEQDLTLPFAGDMVILGSPGKLSSGGTPFESDSASGVAVSATGDGERTIRVDSIRAVLPPPSEPAWLGKRPPVPGDWKQTFDDEFTGTTFDPSKWSIYYPNYWDQRAHFSKDNVILGGGLLRLRFDKHRGHAEDDATKPETDWQTGFLTSIGKFRQRYGYFECRMKLPHAPGLWPAFWMMPDRGAGSPNREDTGNGGMEFDILEYLTRYGPCRYNLAMHWDGYGADHKSIGTDHIYVRPDRDGFITAGLLWEPGRVTFYAQGQPVARWTDARVSSVPMYILFTAVSGGWGGNDLTGEGLPDDFVLDYVRAWQRSDLGEPKAP
jgi:beta-glucanase (GH16 family)